MTYPAGLAWGEADATLMLAGQRRVDVLGNAFAVASTSASLARTLDSLLAAFPGASRPPASERRFLVVDGCLRHAVLLCVHRGGRKAHAASSPAALLSWLLAELNAVALDAFAGFSVHAGVLGRGEHAIALPAESGGGKTTLVAAALLAGFDYVSDEALCVDFDSREVVAFPRPLVVSTWSRDCVGAGRAGVELAAGEWALTPGHLGADVAVSPLRLTDVVHPVRRPGPAALLRCEKSAAMGWLLGQSFNHYRRPVPSFTLAADLARRAHAWSLEFDDPHDAAHLLLERLGRQ